MIVKPDDQVLDYCLYQLRIKKALKEIRKFLDQYDGCGTA